MPPSDSAALHFVKTAETGDSPASASPILAPETLASSLASAAAWSCAGPRYFSGIWPARPTRPCSPPSSACPSRSQNTATPAPHDRKPSGCVTCTPSGVRAVSFCSGYDARSCASGPTQNCPHSLRPQCQSHLWPSVFRAGPTGLPFPLQATALRYTLPARSESSAAPATHTPRRATPTAVATSSDARRPA
jgi:hypothetical protein